ncbi:expressed unknown protein [Ectocarpus siliculosus]|uniref:Uncharacterized protein n=1 Tax=Ectocarpus siliculosus TaxID=2880 RepID=D7FSH6_ECTSI|nr:expressed unknown protein [Ectocarpus siliculosus]|eukprot:CBJ31117.1 expressed unknown protein [Ectocarpus siliculosus]
MRTIVSRSMPRAGGGHDDHPHLVFETAKEPFTKFSAGLIVGGGVFAGIGIVVGAITHQNYKHGFGGKK